MEGVKMNILSQIPAVDRLKEHERFQAHLAKLDISEHILTDWLNGQITGIRNDIVNERLQSDSLTREKIMELIFNIFDIKEQLFLLDYLHWLINITWVV